MTATPNLNNSWIELTFPTVTTNSDSYLTVGHFIFHGTDTTGLPDLICVIGGMHDANTVCGVRVYDHTNAQVVVEKLDITASNPTLVDLGPISNLPLDMAVWEIQVRRVSGSGTKKVAAGSLSMHFP
jgi:hypothetical protein